MTQFQVGVGRPIYNAQEFLRVIAQSNESLSPIVADGIFGVETERAVRVFQTEYNLPQTGEIDNATWDKIIEVYTETKIYTTPVMTSLFPSPDHKIREGDRADFHYPIQAMIFALSKRFDNIDEFDEISNLHQGGVVNTTKQLQLLMGLDCNGELDIKCWNMLSRLYENVVAKETFDIGLGAPKPPVPYEPPVKDNTDEEFREGFVSRDELDEDMRREAGEMDHSMFRNGIITPRLEPVGPEISAETPEGDVTPPPASTQQNSNRDMQSESLRSSTEEQIQSDRRENTAGTPMPAQTKPKMPPLRWNLR